MASETARNVLTFAREMKLIDETTNQQLLQIFSHRVDAQLVQGLIIGREQALAKDLVKVIAALQAAETLGYTLRFVADVAHFCPNLISALARNDDGAFVQDPVTLFGHIATTHRAELGVFSPAILLYGATIGASPDLDARAADIKNFLSIVQSVLSLPELMDPSVEYVVPALCHFLRRPELRPAFAATNMVPNLTRLLSQCITSDSATMAQRTYETLWALRLCTFDFHLLAVLHDSKVTAVVHRVLQRATKEKVIRMALHVINNFIKAQALFIRMQKGELVTASVAELSHCNRNRGPSFYGEFIGMGMLKTLGQLLRKNFGDDDIRALIEEIMKVLECNMDDTTPFSEYLGEIHSGVLEWSAPHTSVKFWKENIKNIEASDFIALRDLGALLLSSNDETTLAVACHDVGEIVRHHPTGRLILTMPNMKGIKEKVMQLMSSPSSEVAKHALTAVQKILIHKWDR